MKTVDLRWEAAAEARRLANARALTRRGDNGAMAQLEGDATWVAFTDRAKTRTALDGRICCVWRVALEDAAGRRLESCLVAVLVHRSSDGKGRQMRPLVENIEAAARSRIEAACDEWATAAARLTRAFAVTRADRDEEIAASPQSSPRPSQPGLFDRRADRSRQADAAARAGAERSPDDSRRATAAPVRRAARLLLVLVP